MAKTWIVAGIFAVGLATEAAAHGLPDRPEGWQTRVNQDAVLIGEFQKLVERYVEVLKKADATLPEASSSAPPAQVEAHRRAVERAIAQARAKAGQGDIFTQPIRAYFRRQLARALSGPDGAKVRATIMEENPGRIKLRINGPYPDAVPISTMPPRILAALPKLPSELEYRFIGERLVLLDIHAQLIVDYMDDAVPR